MFFFGKKWFGMDIPVDDCVVWGTIVVVLAAAAVVVMVMMAGVLPAIE